MTNGIFPQLIPQLIQLYRGGKFPIDRVSKTYPAESVDEAIEDMRTGAVSRNLFREQPVIRMLRVSV